MYILYENNEYSFVLVFQPQVLSRRHHHQLVRISLRHNQWFQQDSPQRQHLQQQLELLLHCIRGEKVITMHVNNQSFVLKMQIGALNCMLQIFCYSFVKSACRFAGRHWQVGVFSFPFIARTVDFVLSFYAL